MAGILSFIGNRAPTGAVALKQDLFGAAIGATAQNISDGINWIMNSQNNKSNREIADSNNAAAIALARENNAWQGDMLRQNQEWSSAEAEKAYNRELEKMRLEMEYNSPTQQVARLRAAGLNPALAFGGSNTSSVVGSTAPQAQPVSSGVTPSMPVLSSPRMEAFRMASPAAAMRDIGEALAAMSAAKKAGAETNVLEAAFSDIVRKYKADADFAEVGATLEREFGRGDRTRSQKMADQKIAESVETVRNLAKQGLYTEALTAVAKVDELIKKNELDKSNVELEYLPVQLRASIEGIKAAAARDRSQASLNQKLGLTEDRLREVRHNLFSSQQKQAESAAQELAEIARKYAIENGLMPNEMHWPEIQKMYLQQIREDLKSKEFENTWTGRFLHSLSGPAATIGSSAIGAGARIYVAP